MPVNENNIRKLIYRSCQTLDDEEFKSYLELLTPEFRYKISAYSPEIRKDMIWLDHDRVELESLFKMLPEHVRMPGKFLRQVAVCDIEPAQKGKTASALSSVVVIYTDLQGVSRLFAAGRYYDIVDLKGVQPKLASRHVRLDTRDLTPGAHIPV